MEKTRDTLYSSYILSRKWSFYEVYESYPFKRSDKPKDKDYLENINTVGTFDNLLDFAFFWKTMPYSKLTPLFNDPHGIVKKIKDKDLKIGSLALFLDKVQPMWEDPINSMGGEYSIKLTNAEP